jgi:hypothetical protein
MSTDRDVVRSVRSWLKEDRHEDADRVLDLVLDQLDATPQRQAGWLAGRLPLMNSTTLRFGIAAAVVVAAAVLGITLLARPNTNVGPSVPTATPTPPQSPSPDALLPLSNQTGPTITPGTYLIDAPFPVRLAITVPGGWFLWTVDFHGAGIILNTNLAEGSGWGLFFLPSGDKLYADPCDKTQGTLEPTPGPTVDDLVAALASLPHMTASNPVDIEVDGHRGKLIQLTAPADAASCPAGSATLWEIAGYDDYAMALGETLPIRIVDVDGVRLVIVATDYSQTSAWELRYGEPYDPNAHADDQVELREIVDSISINP